jgi:hypothetical protein
MKELTNMTKNKNRLNLIDKHKIKSIIDEQISIYKNLSDFDLREQLGGYRILGDMMLRQYYNKESYEFKVLRRLLFFIFKKMFDKAVKDLKKFFAKCYYKKSTKSKKIELYEFCYLYERNANEVIKRLKANKEFNKYKNGELVILEIKEITN